MTPTTETDTTIIGAGVIGLAVAARLAGSCKDIFVIEKNSSYGMETSSRNSEVIHAGIYYPKNSLKAQLCLKGNRQLYQRCRERRLRHLACGKLIVATSAEEEETLAGVRKTALDNGVTDLAWLSKEEIQVKEPNINARAALFSPRTGVIDAHQYMQSLYKEARLKKVEFIFGTAVKAMEPKGQNRYQVDVIYPDNTSFTFLTRRIINCAGHGAHTLAAMMGIDIDKEDYTQHFWKGDYFSVETTPFPVKHLIYPVPLKHTTGLGIHATIDINGRLKLGPDATYLADNTPNYRVDPDKRDRFFDAVKGFLPFIQRDALVPDMAGIRPKRQKPGDPTKDFLIREEKERGLPGVVNLIGMESPGLTASPAIADHVADLLNGRAISS